MSEARGLAIGFSGAGTVGTALATALAERGYRVVAVASRSPSSAERLAARIAGCAAMSPVDATHAADLLFLTVPDDAIREVAASLPWRAGQMAVHCSGATPLEALAAAREAGTLVGAFHPLQTFSDTQHAREALVAGSTFATEAEEPLRGILHQISDDLGGRTIDLGPGDRTLYHISGVLASNYLVALVAEAATLWEQFGVSRADAVAALLPLVQGTVGNLDRQGVPKALTGPIARGDKGTIAAHLATLREKAPGLVPLYCEMARRTVPLALEKGRITRAEAKEILALVEGNVVREGR